jgi:hypothetical protein
VIPVSKLVALRSCRVLAVAARRCSKRVACSHVALCSFQGIIMLKWLKQANYPM